MPDKQPHRWYTNKDDAHIRRWYGIKTAKQIGEELGRHHGSIMKRAQRLGLRSGKWSFRAKDVQKIRDLIFAGASIHEISAECPGSSPDSIRHRVKDGGCYTAADYRQLCENNRRANKRK